MKKSIIAVLLFLDFSLLGNTYYVSQNGSDSNAGDIQHPFASLNRAWQSVAPGDIVYVRGGTYNFGSQQVLVGKSGTQDNLIKVWAYPGENPVISRGSSYSWQYPCGVFFKGDYVHFKGLEISGYYQESDGYVWSGLRVEDSNHNIFELLNIHHNGHGFRIQGSSDGNLILNCDIHHNQDPKSSDTYGNGDGLEITYIPHGVSNTVSGCRFWWNTDDGIDLIQNDGYVEVVNCWSWYNGYIPDTFTSAGNGNGFKLGGVNGGYNYEVLRSVRNCMSFHNKNHGFDQNQGTFIYHLYNNTSYQNANAGFCFNMVSGLKHVFNNNIAYGNLGYQTNVDYGWIESNNSWDNGFSVSNADFVSLSNSGLDGQRKSDGSLPDVDFLHLTGSSKLIDAGKDVGYPYNGNAPDLGCFETGVSSNPGVEPVYVSSLIQDPSPAWLAINFNVALASTLPPISSLTVKVNSVIKGIDYIVISGNQLCLALSESVKYGDVITVTYSKPGTNPLQSSAGVEAQSFGPQTVNNRVSAVSVPVFSSASIKNATPANIEMVYNMALANTVPAISSFSVMVNSANRTINSVSISGSTVILILASPVAFNDQVTVTYTKPASNALQNAAGGEAASLTSQKVTNNVGPVTPALATASVENASPTKLVLTYNMALSAINPAASAFAVSVNSVTRAVTAVSVSGTTVTLTLASAVANGNTIKVSYTKPASNPIQTPAGGQASSFTGQSVTNNVQVSNAPPVVMVNYHSEAYSGFVEELSASGSYDTNKDKLTFSWVIPGNIPVSSTTGPTIDYLSPVTDVARTVNFVVNVSDGKTVQSKTIPVQILPYEPGLDVAQVAKVEASSYSGTNLPANIVDGNIGTMWAADGDNQWLLLTLKEPFSVQHVKLAFQPGQKTESFFDILGSVDTLTWEPVLTKSNSCAFSGDLQVFDFPATKASKEFRYIKLIGHGNSTTMWNYLSEFRIFGYKHKNPSNYAQQPVKIYPNPAHDYFNVKIEETSLTHDFLRIVSITGSTLFEERVDPTVSEFQVPIDLKTGVYIVQIGTKQITLFSQKLVVGN